MARVYDPAKKLITRRAFARKAAFLAAASAVEFPIWGCGESQLDIPCLGPAAPSTPIPGMTYIRASEIGCALDCDLRTGRNKHTGGAATDDGPRINATMAGASADNPITLIIDGSASISGLFLPAKGNWGIAGLGCGTGFFVKTGTNNDGIHNGPLDAAIPTNPGPPVPARGTNVSLSNFTLNGNQGNGHSGDSTSGLRQGGSAWYFGINLMNLDNITIDKVVVVNSPSFHIRLSNVGMVTVSGCVMQSSGVYTDGLHFDGPANDITISNCQFATGDDSIALNCPEGYTGNISRVQVTGCTFNSWSLMRLYTTAGGANDFIIDSVSVSKCSGTLQEAAFLIGLLSESKPNAIATLTVSDCNLKAPAVLGVSESFGTIVLNNVMFTPWQSSSDVFDPSQPDHVLGLLRPPPPYASVPYAGSNLIFNNCKMALDGVRAFAAVVLDEGATINNIEFDNFAVTLSNPLFPMAELIDIDGGGVGQLILNSVSSGGIRAPVTEHAYQNVGSISGKGLLATGWSLPDPVMADEVPYISARTGLPSIKVNGVVEPYSP